MLNLVALVWERCVFNDGIRHPKQFAQLAYRSLAGLAAGRNFHNIWLQLVVIFETQKVAAADPLNQLQRRRKRHLDSQWYSYSNYKNALIRYCSDWVRTTG